MNIDGINPATDFESAFDAVIIGAGPAGSAAAILLARAGWSVALVEKQRFPRRKVCGECIAASNLQLLDGLGMGALIAQDAGPELRKVALMRGDTVVVADMPAAADARFAWGRALGRETLDFELVEAARRAGVAVLQPWAVQSIEGGAGDWRLAARSAQDHAVRQLRARVAIAAHGSWETLPSGRARRRLARSAADLFAFKANFSGASLVPGCLPVLALDGGYGGMVLADRGVVTVACCVRRDRRDALRSHAPGRCAGDVVEDWLRQECAGVGRALRGAGREGPWLASGPIDPGIRVRPTDQLLRIGNAAGEAHPILGEGISMALQSAGLLCAELLQGQVKFPLEIPLEIPPEDPSPGRRADAVWQAQVARRYAVQWRKQFAPRLRLGAAAAQLAMRPGTSGLVMALAQAWPGLLTRSARWGGKIRSAADPALFQAPHPAPQQMPQRAPQHRLHHATGSVS
jgi:2-polyprenyl-6-methoxyphenol hydroxylase-like FAD-dependent oxidoreductase